MRLNEPHDGDFQLFNGRINSATQLLFCQQPEKSFYQVQPGCAALNAGQAANGPPQTKMAAAAVAAAVIE